MLFRSVKLSAKDIAATPAADNLYLDGRGKRLDARMSEMFHRMVAKGIFICKRGRPDIQPTIAALCTRVADAREGDWKRLIRLMRYLNGTKDLTLKLDANGNMRVIKWYVDASFAVHSDFKSHTGAVMMFDDSKGAVQSISRKQKLNTRSSTEAE